MNKTPLFKIHNDNLSKLQNKEKDIPMIEQRLQELSEQIPRAKETDIIVYKKMLVERREKEAELKALKKEKLQYLTKTSSALCNYMDAVANPKKITKGIELLKSKNKVNREVSEKYSKYRELRSIIDKDYAYTENKTLNDENYCYSCQKFRVSLEDDAAVLVCPDCHTQVTVTEFYVKLNSTENTYNDKKQNEYQRFAHYCSWLDNIQGKSKVVIPESVVDLVKKEIYRERMSDRMHELDEFDIRRYLQKHRKKGLDKFYDNCSQILYEVTGFPPLQMTSDMEHNMKLLFMAIQEPFELFKSEKRHNFSSYSSILYKFCQLLGYTQFLPKLKLPKNPKIRYENDIVWKKICEYMGGEEKGWTFIKYDY